MLSETAPTVDQRHSGFSAPQDGSIDLSQRILYKFLFVFADNLLQTSFPLRRKFFASFISFS